MGRLEIDIVTKRVDRDGDETGSSIVIDGDVDFERSRDGTVMMTLRLDHETLEDPEPIKRPPPTREATVTR